MPSASERNHSAPAVPVALLAFVLVAGIASTAAAQDLYYADPGGAEALAGSGAVLVWSTDDCLSPPGAFEICAIRQAFAATMALPTSPRRAYDSSGGSGSASIASNLAVRSGDVYWLSASGQVLRKYAGYGGSDFDVIAGMENPGATGEIAVDGHHVWWLENVSGVGRVFRAPLDGGPREFVIEAPDDTIHDLQVDGSGGVAFLADIDAVFCCVDPLHRVVPDGVGGYSETISALSFIDGYVLDASEVFVASRVNAGANLTISRAPLASIASLGAWTTLYDAGNTGPPSIPHLALDEDDVFWHEQSPLGGSPLLRMPRAGGPPAAITSSLLEAEDLLVAGDYRQQYAFWREAGDLYRVPIDAGAFTRDLDADDLVLEVTQAIQDPAHTIPLTEGKRTYVRAYARLAASSDGATQLTLFPGMLLEGTRGGIPLEGSPLRPIERGQPILATTVDRTRPDNQRLFELPESWTSGTIVLKATVDPRDVEFESDETNNSTSRTVTFTPIGGICMDIIPILTTLGVERGQPAWLRAQTFARARTLLPTDDLVWIFRGGTPKSKPFTGDPYNMFETDDTREMMYHWWHDFVFASTPSQCGSRRTIRTAAVSNSGRAGLSSGAAAIIYYAQWMGGVAENAPSGGTVGLAHEVGHQLGQGHVDCTDTATQPGDPDGSYPYDPCTIEDDNTDHLGFDPISQKIIVPFDGDDTSQYQDYMSYATTFWSSDYVYRNHWNELASGTPSPPVAGAGPMLVSGFDRGDGTVEIGFSYELDPASLANAEAILGDSTLPSTDYRVHVYDTNGLLQVDEPLRAAPTEEEVAGDPILTALFGLVETDPGYDRIEITDGLGNVLASRKTGPGKPGVVFDAPLAGTMLVSPVTVQWTGNDPEGDTLEYRLLYSPDGGTSWIDLVTTRTNQAVVELDDLPTGKNVFFKLHVSDGLQSDTAFTGPFSIENRPPEVTLLLDDWSPPAGTATYSYDAPVALRAIASDSDDGPLRGTSLSWALTGATTWAGSGEAFSLLGVPPGDYLAVVTAQDADGLSASDSLQVSVLPKPVPAAGAIALDGRCVDDVYADDTGHAVLRYESGAVAEGAMAEVGDGLFLCLAGLEPSQTGEYVELRLDADASADAVMQPDDRYVRIFRDGAIQSGIGDGGGGDFADGEEIDAFAVVDDEGPLGWHAEIQLGASLVDPLFGLGVRHVQQPLDPEEAVDWPPSHDRYGPTTWAQVQRLPEPGLGAGLVFGWLWLATRARRRVDRRRRLASIPAPIASDVSMRGSGRGLGSIH